jgi:hypothetical protein
VDHREFHWSGGWSRIYWCSSCGICVSSNESEFMQEYPEPGWLPASCLTVSSFLFTQSCYQGSISMRFSPQQDNTVSHVASTEIERNIILMMFMVLRLQLKVLHSTGKHCTVWGMPPLIFAFFLGSFTLWSSYYRNTRVTELTDMCQQASYFFYQIGTWGSCLVGLQLILFNSVSSIALDDRLLSFSTAVDLHGGLPTP